MEPDIELCLDGVFWWHAVCPCFVGALGHLQIGLYGLPSLPDVYSVLMNITCTQ